jgi:hypothetical protein
MDWTGLVWQRLWRHRPRLSFCRVPPLKQAGSKTGDGSARCSKKRWCRCSTQASDTSTVRLSMRQRWQRAQRVQRACSRRTWRAATGEGADLRQRAPVAGGIRDPTNTLKMMRQAFKHAGFNGVTSRYSCKTDAASWMKRACPHVRLPTSSGTRKPSLTADIYIGLKKARPRPRPRCSKISFNPDRPGSRSGRLVNRSGLILRAC